MFCPNCGQPQTAGFTFCSRCGCRLIQPENMTVPPADTSTGEPTPEEIACDQAAQPGIEEIAAPSNPWELPGGDPAAIPDETGTYAPPAQPYSPVPYPQYGCGAAQYSPYPYYGVPTAPQYPQMSGTPYMPNPYVPTPAYPGVPPYPQMNPAAPPAENKDVPPAKVGRRRVPILIMAVLVTLGLLLFFFGPDLPVSTGEEDTAQSHSETPWFRNEDGTLYFDSTLYTGPSELTIPETVDGEPVICIAQDCFAGNDTITTVVLPNGLEEIGSGAFADCSALRGIYIPEGVKFIGSGAFEDCVSLEAVYIPNSVAAIGRNAFRGCSKLAHVMYDGTYEQWYDLYSSYINSETKVYCSDGTVPQGRVIP